MGRLDTFLSPYVANLLSIQEAYTPEVGQKNRYIKDGVLDLPLVEALLPPDFSASKLWFTEAVTCLAPVLEESRSFWNDRQVYQEKQLRLRSWALSPELCLYLDGLMESGNTLEFILFVSPLLERSLGGLLLSSKTLNVASQDTEPEGSKEEDNVRIPSLLRDLVQEPELENILGTTLIRVLQVAADLPISNRGMQIIILYNLQFFSISENFRYFLLPHAIFSPLYLSRFEEIDHFLFQGGTAFPLLDSLLAPGVDWVPILVEPAELGLARIRFSG